MSVRRQQGYSLIGAIIGLTIAAVLLSMLSIIIDVSLRRSAGPQIEIQALNVAEAYLEEILSLPLRDPDSGTLCPSAPVTRDDFNDVCDYRDFNEAVARGISAALVSGPGQFSVSVSVLTDNLAVFHPDCDSATPRCARITVNVTPPTGPDVSLSAYAVDVDA